MNLNLIPGTSASGIVIHGKSGTPISDARVVFTPRERPPDRWEPVDTAAYPADEVYETTTDPAGKFRFEDLAPAFYVVEAVARGFKQSSKLTTKLPAVGKIVIELKKASVVSGVVYDSGGRPVAAARVLVISDSVAGGIAAEIVTKEGGVFSAEVEAGSYRISAELNGEYGTLPRSISVPADSAIRDIFVRLGRGCVIDGVVRERATGREVAEGVASLMISGAVVGQVRFEAGSFRLAAPAGDAYEVSVSAPGFSTASQRDIGLMPGETLRVSIDLMREGGLDGTVSDNAGRPRARILVRAMQDLDLRLQAWTDDTGRYHIDGLRPGKAEAFLVEGEMAASPSKQVEIPERGRATQDFVLMAPGRVSGVVRNRAGLIPSQAVRVVARPHSLSLTGEDRGVQAMTDRTGQYSVALPPGEYELTASLDPIRATGVVVKVMSEEEVRLDLVLAEEDGPPLELSGRVIEPDGNPSPQALVVAIDQTSGGHFARADADGRFSMHIRTTDLDQETSLSARNGNRASELVVTKGAGRDVVLTLRATSGVRGRILGNGRIEGFEVTVEYPERFHANISFPKQAHRFPGDRFELSDLVPASRLRLTATTSDGGTGQKEIELKEGEVVDVTIDVSGKQ